MDQFKIPSKLNYLANVYPLVSWSDALVLYRLAVNEVLIYYHANNLTDDPLSFGRGFVYAAKLFEEKLKNMNTIQIKKLEREIEKEDEE